MGNSGCTSSTKRMADEQDRDDAHSETNATQATRREARGSTRQSQKARILTLLEGGEWVELPRILALQIGQYNARIGELRAAGYDIQNRIEWQGRVCHSWFRWVR